MSTLTLQATGPMLQVSISAPDGTLSVATTRDVLQSLLDRIEQPPHRAATTTPNEWPEPEQFDRAATLGAQKAFREVRRGEGISPDGMPVDFGRYLAAFLGFMPDNEEHAGIEELRLAWNRGYFDVWQHESGA